MEKYKVSTKMPDLPDEDSGLSLFDQENPDIGFMNSIDEELIRLGGSKAKYFKYYGKDNFDKVYLEERNKVIDKNAITVWVSYDPSVIEENLAEFGVELHNNQVFVFNKSYITRKLGREPVGGDIIQPTFQNIKYEIFEVQEDSFEVYGVYHYNCHARILRDSNDVQDQPLDTFDKVEGLTVL